MSPPWPDPDDLAELHRRLLVGDPLAPSDFASAVLDPLVADIRSRNPGADDHAVVQAVEDAILSVIRKPTTYDSSRGEMAAFFRMAAQGDLRNALNRERKHHANRIEQDPVELGTAGGNVLQDDADNLPSFDDPRLAAVIAGFTDAERWVFDLMRDGERKTDEFATALGIADRPTDEQAAEVKRAKDRIKQRLKRAAEGP